MAKWSNYRERQLGTVYIVQRGLDGPVKIGVAANLKGRLHQIQTCCPEPIRLLGAIDANANFEVSLQDFYAKHRVRGEWFRPDPDLIGMSRLFAKVFPELLVEPYAVGLGQHECDDLPEMRA